MNEQNDTEAMQSEALTAIEEAIVSELTSLYPTVTAEIQRARRIWAVVDRAISLEVFAWLHDQAGFITLCTITGLDTGEEYHMLYHLADESGIVFNVRLVAPHSDPFFSTISDIYKNSVLYELEARNLLGLTIPGIPDDIRYPLPDNWPEGQYPLRKDWQPFDETSSDVLPDDEDGESGESGADEEDD